MANREKITVTSIEVEDTGSSYKVLMSGKDKFGMERWGAHEEFKDKGERIHTPTREQSRSASAIYLNISPKANELVRYRLGQEVGFFSEIITRDDIPKRSENLPNYRTPETPIRLL